MGVLHYDEEAARRLLAAYTTPDVVQQRARFLDVLELRPSERVLDVGSGPGLLLASIADQVGSEGRAVGVDISAPLLSIAQEPCADRPWVTLCRADARHLPFADGRFDVGVSTQVLEYVADVDTAVSELSRVVRPGGRIAILDTDWDSIVWHGPDSARMNRVLQAWEAHAAHPRLPRTLAPRLRRAGLRVEEQRVMPLLNAEFEHDSYSNRAIDVIASFVAAGGAISRDDAETWAQELRDAGAGGEYFFSLNRYLFLASKP
jgi:ubiquinone/menaquinone biosynthesis C-methylase UbiE